MIDRSVGPETARHIREWDHEDGDVLWWTNPVTEPPYVGTPEDSNWPCYHEHWTPLPAPPVVFNEPKELDD